MTSNVKAGARKSSWRFVIFVLQKRLARSLYYWKMDTNLTPLFMQQKVVESDNFKRFATNNEPCIMGIDEAGRGPVLGSMVYACALASIPQLNDLNSMGIDDSKKLKADKREAVLKKLENSESVAYAYLEHSARSICSNMLSLRQPRNLNEISHGSAVTLIQHAIDSGINVTEVYVDTVGPKAKYQEYLQSMFPKLKIVVEEKADGLFKIVGAASIVAKTTRDRLLDKHVFDEIDMTKPLNGFGSGYGDPETMTYLSESFNPVFGYSTLVRFTWKNVAKAVEDNAVKCKWIEPDSPKTLLSFFQKVGAEPQIEKRGFFKNKKIKHMSWITKLVFVGFIAYIAKSLHVFYELFHYNQCDRQLHPKLCISPFIYPNPNWPPVQLRVYINNKNSPDWTRMQHIFTKQNLDLSKALDQTIQLEIPATVRRNGTLQAYVFLMNNEFKGEDFEDTEWLIKDSLPLTIYTTPKAETFNLMSNETTHQSKSVRPVTHLRSILPINVMTESLILNRADLPDEIRHYIYLVNEGSSRSSYLPFMDLDDMRIREKDLVEIKRDTEALNLTISYLPISWGRFRLSATMKLTFSQFMSLGFSNKDIDDMKSIFAETNFYFLALTVVVATVHMFFDYLTFKNDIKFWRGRKTMVGISTKTLLWRCFSDTVIFFYLLDEKTSYLVLVPSGICALIEFWKLQKALKVSVKFEGWKPKVSYGDFSDQEKESGSFDMEGMRYLTYLLIPLCIGGAIYNLIYVPQRSWISWCIKCLANCCYAFGFLFMLPQLFLNYKLKSVSGISWRAFTYKAFNTFIDDVFSFIITMPTTHRLACFRDDVVFFIYLYQRYLYPVDKTRVNEFGETFDDDEQKEKKEQ
ncbi:Ribonuclease [Aphelenchoides bicaudatus]|nr:Ribonuclease [Aphelenchoides bicaudatus]